MKKTLLALLLGAALYGGVNHTGVVQETLSSGGYTYMKVQDGKNSYWIAMTQRDVKKGDKVAYTEQGWMRNFHSKTLNRTFDKILFAGNIEKPKAHTQTQQLKTNMHSDYKEKHTLSVAELFANRDKYVGKTVTVKGKVTKTSKGIMKLNWLHIQDGSNFQNMNDLVFTSTQALPEIGKLIYATGTVVKDKDFGYGYFYPLIVQNASFKK
ncbi:MAG: GW dipeptide domain-containing protein [Sulfurimonas sp.]|nr:GW dipeptide domain-containing protein [Sulfurimonas sp.]